MPTDVKTGMSDEALKIARVIRAARSLVNGTLVDMGQFIVGVDRHHLNELESAVNEYLNKKAGPPKGPA